jgi:two-component system NarL family response regulator
MPTAGLGFPSAGHCCIRLVAVGKTNKEIASVLFITEGTIKTHVNNILEKLGVRDRTEAVMTALRRGILHL